MNSDKLRYLLIGALSFLLLAALGVLGVWTLDNVFNGVGLDYLESLVIGTDESAGAIFFDKARIARDALIVFFAIAALLCATGAFCAYRAHAKQRARLLRVQAEAERAREAAAREAQRKSDLITYLAHDLKTPLASVVAYLSLLEESPDLDDQHRAKYTSIALEKAYRLEQLIGELFEIIRFNLQTIELDKKQIDLRLLLMQLTEEFYPILLPRGMRIDTDCPRDLTLVGDADKLARVFNNILKNAVAYGENDAAIRVSARGEGGRVTVTFVNQGAEIPKEKLDRVFEKFYRADDARSSRTGGAGLGLAIAREIVEAHGGVISAQSTRESTVFTVSLPSGA